MARVGQRFSFSARVWQHESTGGWHFVSLPEPVSDEIEHQVGPRAAGFGSVRVEVSIGGSRWTTSVFPDATRKTYVLPLKKAVRTAEGLAAGSTATVELLVVH